MELEEILECWIEYYQSIKNNKEWKRIEWITGRCKIGKMPYCKIAFKNSFINGKTTLFYFAKYMFIEGSIRSIRIDAIRELASLELHKKMAEEDIENCFYWNLIIKIYLGFLIEYKIKTELESNSFVIKESEELDNKYKIDLKISKGYKSVILQIKNFSYVLAYEKNKGYNGMHQNGLMEYQKTKSLECSKVGFVFYSFVEDGIRLCHTFGAEGIITTPTEVELYHNWDCNAYKDIEHLVEEVREILI